MVKNSSGDKMITELFSSIKAIVVDYYGTLVDVGQPFLEIKRWFADKYNDSIGNIDDLYMAFLKEHARLLCNKEFYLGQSLLMKSYKKSCDKYNIPFLSEDFQKLIIKLFIQPPAFSAARQTIENLRKSFPVLLLTNADNQILYESIKIQGFEFDYIVSSEDLKCNKPNAKMFQAACNLLKTFPKQVLMIGDSLTEDIYGAIEYGMEAIWINREKADIANKIPQLVSICELVSILQKEAII